MTNHEKNPNHNYERTIDPCGVDQDGIFCYWTGFDKTQGKFFGKPFKKEKPVDQQRVTNIFSSQQRT